MAQFLRCWKHSFTRRHRFCQGQPQSVKSGVHKLHIGTTLSSPCHITAPETDHWPLSSQVCCWHLAILTRCRCMPDSQLWGQLFSTWFALIQRRHLKTLRFQVHTVQQSRNWGEYVSINTLKIKEEEISVLRKQVNFHLLFCLPQTSKRSQKKWHNCGARQLPHHSSVVNKAKWHHLIQLASMWHSRQEDFSNINAYYLGRHLT